MAHVVSGLPEHGRVDCSLCHTTEITFDRTKTVADDWRVTANPLAWGNTSPKVVVLGFSKGPTQSGALASGPHDAIAYKGSRGNVGKILAHIGLLPGVDPSNLSATVDRLIADRSGDFHFGSLIRCTVERFDGKKGWVGTGGGMLDRFIADPFGRRVAISCAGRFLSVLPERTKLVVMFGLGTRQGYVHAARRLFETARRADWKAINDVAYSDDKITVVHVEHFASQGSLIQHWLSGGKYPRGRLGLFAREAVMQALQLGSVQSNDRYSHGATAPHP